MCFGKKSVPVPEDANGGPGDADLRSKPVTEKKKLLKGARRKIDEVEPGTDWRRQPHPVGDREADREKRERERATGMQVARDTSRITGGSCL